MEAARVELLNQPASLYIVAAQRDSTLTAVTTCSPGEWSIPDVRLEQHAGILDPFGGAIDFLPEATAHVAFFPPTTEHTLEVLVDGVQVARLRFAAVPVDSCSATASHPFQVEACGALLLVAWQSGLQFSASQVELVDLLAVESASGQALGTYPVGVVDGPSGLVVRFAMERPRSPDVEVLVNGLYGPGLDSALAQPIALGMHLSADDGFG